jgi:hypothetical protein
MSIRIALIHATPVAMQPVSEAFQRGWPEADTINLLDDALSRDLARIGTLDRTMRQRIAALADYAMDIGVDGILYTCSAFGEAIAAVQRGAPCPVLKPNQAMFEDAMRHATRAGLIATFAPSLPSMQQEFLDMATAQGKRIELDTVYVPDAMAALSAGDADTHNRLIADFAARLAHCDVVMLAQFSMAPALALVCQAIDSTVLTSPGSAVAKLKAALAPHHELAHGDAS